LLDDAFASEEYGIGFKKGNTELRDKVNNALQEMTEDGTMAKISEKWFGEDITTVGK
jgi:polar amino acid transport system substrate-binding protein